jgi:hypothetical protein
MTNAVSLFDSPTVLPAYLQTNAKAAALAAQVEGDLSGGKSINRISLRGAKFRFVKAGVEVGMLREPTMEVIVVAANPHVSRTFYLKQYNQDDVATRPDCYSRDGRAPEQDSPAIQSALCAVCPQNVKGSAINGGKGKACGYGKRVVVVSPTDIEGDAFAIDVKAMSLFGDDDPTAKKFNLRSYIEALKANGLIVPAVITQLSFDDDSSVPKLFFKPIRPLTEQEFNRIVARSESEEVRDMLDDVDNKAEEGKPVGQIAAPTPQPLGPPLTNQHEMNPPSAAPGFPTGTPPAAPAAKRGKPKATETPPAAAPAPQAAPAGGFGAAMAPAAAPQAQTPPPAVNGGGKGFTVDLADFDN